MPLQRELFTPLIVLAILLTPATSMGQPPSGESVLAFEAGAANGIPAGWRSGGEGPDSARRIAYDQHAVHTGRGAARLNGVENLFTGILRRLPLQVQGQTLELRGYLRVQDVKQFGGLWLRQDNDEGTVAFVNMRTAGLTDTRDWAKYSVTLPLDVTTRSVAFGVQLSGPGVLWADDLQLLVDGQPVATAPRRPLSARERDHQFDAGSGLAVADFSPAQIANVAVLGRIWGYLKYYHPAVSAGELQWDYELFRMLPEILDADSTKARNSALSAWLARLGVPDSCDPCAPDTPTAEVHFAAPLGWIEDIGELGEALSGQLQAVYAYRSGAGRPFYGPLWRDNKRVFGRERRYPGQQAPDAGYRLLALFRVWNIVQYWAPYRDLIADDWDGVLAEFIPAFVGADTADAYTLALLRLLARIRDGHAYLTDSARLKPPRGTCAWPIDIRFVGERPVVEAVHPVDADAATFQAGDVITAIDGTAVEALIAGWEPYYAASNRAGQLRDIAASMTRGACGTAKATALRGNQHVELQAARTPIRAGEPHRHDRPGAAFQRLSPEVAYLKLSAARIADIDSYIEQARGTRGFIIDIRNYPAEFVMPDLAGRFVETPTAFSLHTRIDPANPGRSVWDREASLLQPTQSGYRGRLVVLVDEISQSQSEYTTMALRAAGATVIGSTTSGADGNMLHIPLPGDRGTAISGVGVFYPDKRSTQQVGIVPDITVKATIESLRAGRDVVLDTAIERIGAGTAIRP